MSHQSNRYRIGRTPDYYLKALDKDTNDRGKVGAGWNNEDGSITIKLDPFVTLRGSDNLSLHLFPNDL